MAETARLKLPLMEAAQAQKHVTHNEAITMLDLLFGIIPVLDRSLSAPPGAVDGAVYILAATGTGGWIGFAAGDLALRIDGAWRRVLPSTGMVASIANESGTQVYWTGAAWVSVGVARALIGKAAAQSKTTDTTLATDTALQFPMLAGKTYSIRLQVFFSAPATPGFKYALVGPAAPVRVSAERRARAPGTTVETVAGDAAYPASTVIAGNATSHGALFIDLVVENGANPGTFAFQWAQNVSDAGAAVVRAGSTLEWAVIG